MNIENRFSRTSRIGITFWLMIVGWSALLVNGISTTIYDKYYPVVLVPQALMLERTATQASIRIDTNKVRPCLTLLGLLEFHLHDLTTHRNIPVQEKDRTAIGLFSADNPRLGTSHVVLNSNILLPEPTHVYSLGLDLFYSCSGRTIVNSFPNLLKLSAFS